MTVFRSLRHNQETCKCIECISARQVQPLVYSIRYDRKTVYNVIDYVEFDGRDWFVNFTGYHKKTHKAVYTNRYPLNVWNRYASKEDNDND